MTPRQRRFVLEYLIDANALRAARRAGYHMELSHGNLSKLLRKPAVRAALEDAMAARARRTGITPERVLDELVRVAFAEIAAVVTWDADGPLLKDSATLSDGDCAAIAELATAADGSAVTVRLHDKGAALALLARRLGLVAGRGASGPAAEAAGIPGARALVEAVERMRSMAAPRPAP